MCRLLSFVLCIVICTVTAQDRTRCRTDLAFLVDESGSISDDYEPRSQGPTNWNNIRTFLRDVVRKLEVSDISARIALVKFGSGATVEFDLTEYNDSGSIERELTDLQYRGGNTDTHVALELARREVFQGSDDRSTAPNVIVILTDGNATNPDATIRERNNIVNEDDVRILGVGVTNAANEQFMRERLITNRNTDYIGVNDFASLNSDVLISRLVRSVCPPEQCTIDLALAIDSSGSIQKDNTDNWNLVLDFAAGIVRELNNQARVAVITYANEATQYAALGQYNENQLLNVINNNINWTDGETNTTGALRHIERYIFQRDNGDRQEARNVIILFTDGQANRESGGLSNQAKSLKDDGTLIITVGVTDNIDGAELRTIASSEMNILIADRFTDLNSLVVSAVTQACGGAIPAQDPTPPTTTPTTTTTTRRPESGCPALGDTVAFSAYSMHTTAMQMSENDKLMFDQTEENRGGLYSTSNFEFTCTCTGLYRFAFTASHVDQGFVFAIFVDNQQKQPVAYANPNGHVATETITTCNRGQRVSVRVVRLSDQRTLGCTFEGDSTLGFTGYMLVPYR